MDELSTGAERAEMQRPYTVAVYWTDKEFKLSVVVMDD